MRLSLRVVLGLAPLLAFASCGSQPQSLPRVRTSSPDAVTITTVVDTQSLATKRALSHRKFIDPPLNVELMPSYKPTFEDAINVVATPFVLPASWPKPHAIIAGSAVGGSAGEGEIVAFYSGTGVDGRLVSIVADPNVTPTEAQGKFDSLRADVVPTTPGLRIELADVGKGLVGVIMNDDVIASIEVWKAGIGSVLIETDSSATVNAELRRLASELVAASAL